MHSKYSDSEPAPPVTTPPLPVIVGAAILSEGRVLACERAEPAEMRGMWEFPGGKVDPGETEREALARECMEELGVRIAIADRVGEDVLLSHGQAVLKVYVARLVGDSAPHPHEHSDLRWLAAGELDTVRWLPADAPIVESLRPHLR